LPQGGSSGRGRVNTIDGLGFDRRPRHAGVA
jgi:hypothetical protein